MRTKQTDACTPPPTVNMYMGKEICIGFSESELNATLCSHEAGHFTTY
jgi:hypothetical protein